MALEKYFKTSSGKAVVLKRPLMKRMAGNLRYELAPKKRTHH